MATKLLERMKSDAEKLDATEQAELAKFLLEIIGPPARFRSEAALVAELERRTAEFLRDPSVGVPAEKVFAQVRAKLK